MLRIMTTCDFVLPSECLISLFCYKCLTLPLPISHLCDKYLPLSNSHLCEIHMCTCINCNEDIFITCVFEKSPTRMVSDIDAMLSYIFNLCDMRMRIAITCIMPRGYVRGPPVKRSRFLGVGLSGRSLSYC